MADTVYSMAQLDSAPLGFFQAKPKCAARVQVGPSFEHPSKAERKAIFGIIENWRSGMGTEQLLRLKELKQVAWKMVNEW